MKHTGIVGVALVAAALSLPSTTRANEFLRPEIARIATSIKKILDSRGVESIAVGQFSGPAGHLTNYGPGIEDLLGQELRKQKINVDAKAGFKVQGQFVKGLVKDATRPSDLMLLKLIFSVYDRAGEPITDLTLRVEVRDNAELAKILGATGPVGPKGDAYQRNQELQKNLGGKAARIDGSKVFASAASPFAVEILVKPKVNAKATPRVPRYEGNDLFVDIQRDEIYEVHLHNTSHLEAAITLDIDGLSVFTFSELRNLKTGGPRYRHFILPPKSVTPILGWHKRNEAPDNFLSFLVTEYGKGASQRAPQPSGKVGVITVTFAYAWQGPKPPEEERGTQDHGNETGFGPPVSQEVQEVERQIGIVRDVVTIRYARPLLP